MAENPIPRLDHSGSVSSLFSNIGQAIAYGGKVPQYVIDGVSEKKFAMSESVLRSDDFNDKRVADVLQELNMDAYNEVEDELGKKKKEFKFGGDENITVAQLRENPQQMDAFFKAIKKNTSAFTGGKILSKQQSIMQRGTDALINEFALKEKTTMIEDLVAVQLNANIRAAEIVNKDPSKYSKQHIADMTETFVLDSGYHKQRIADIANFGKDAMSGSQYGDTQNEFIQKIVQSFNDVTSDAGKAMVYKSLGVSETDPQESGYIMVQNAMAGEEKNRRNIKGEARRAIVDKMQATGRSAEYVINSSDFGHIFQFEDTRSNLGALNRLAENNSVTYDIPSANIEGYGTATATNGALTIPGLRTLYNLQMKKNNGETLTAEQSKQLEESSYGFTTSKENIVKYIQQEMTDHDYSLEEVLKQLTDSNIAALKKNTNNIISHSKGIVAHIFTEEGQKNYLNATNALQIGENDSPQDIVRKRENAVLMESMLINPNILKKEKEKLFKDTSFLWLFNKEDSTVDKFAHGINEEKRQAFLDFSNMAINTGDPKLISSVRKAFMQNFSQANKTMFALSNSQDVVTTDIKKINNYTPEELGIAIAKDISGMKGHDKAYSMSLSLLVYNENINMENITTKDKAFLAQTTVQEFLVSEDYQNTLGMILSTQRTKKATAMKKKFDTMIQGKVVMKEGGLFDNTFSQWANRNNIHEKSILFGAKDISAADLLASGYPVGTLIGQLDNLLIIKPELEKKLKDYAASVGQDVKDK